MCASKSAFKCCGFIIVESDYKCKTLYLRGQSNNVTVSKLGFNQNNECMNDRAGPDL